MELVLESDGTKIDDPDVLSLLTKDDILILLQKNEKWMPVKLESETVTDVTDTLSAHTSLFNDTLSASSSLISQNLLNISSDSLSDYSVSNIPADIIPVQNIADFQQENQTCRNINEDTWHKLFINWEELRKETIEECQKGTRNKQCIAEVVHLVVTAMRHISTFLPSPAIKIVSQKVVDRFPSTFKDVDEDGIIIGDGNHTIFSKIQDRNNYLNRPHKSQSCIHIPRKKTKIMLNCRAGCQNWQPDNHPDNQPDDQHKEKLLKMSCEDDEFFTILEKTYGMQRQFINNPQAPTIHEVLKEWPLIFKKKVIRWHYEKLMGHKINTLFENLLAKENKILKYATQKNIKYTTQENMNDLPAEDIKGFCLCDIIAKLLGEDVKNFLVICEVYLK